MLRAVCILGEVFGHLAADRVLEGLHVRLVQRLSVSREVPLLGVTRARVHVRVNRVDHVQESVLRGAGAERLVHEGALDRSSFHGQSVSCVCWARIRCRARAAHGGGRAAKWGR